MSCSLFASDWTLAVDVGRDGETDHHGAQGTGRGEREGERAGGGNLFPALVPTVSLIDSQDTQITGFIRYMFV